MNKEQTGDFGLFVSRQTDGGYLSCLFCETPKQPEGRSCLCLFCFKHKTKTAVIPRVCFDGRFFVSNVALGRRSWTRLRSYMRIHERQSNSKVMDRCASKNTCTHIGVGFAALDRIEFEQIVTMYSTSTTFEHAKSRRPTAKKSERSWFEYFRRGKGAAESSLTFRALSLSLLKDERSVTEIFMLSSSISWVGG